MIGEFFNIVIEVFKVNRYVILIGVFVIIVVIRIIMNWF